MKSDMWRDKRAERMKIDDYACVMCGSKWELEVHHIHYRRLGRENVLTDLCTLCKNCHKKIHRYYDRIK